MERYILIHYGEIALKGGNRQFFENKLISNIKLALKDFGAINLIAKQGRFIVKIDEAWDLALVKQRLLKVFGIEYFAVAWNSTQDIEQIGQDLLSLLKDQKFKSFRITTRRANKSFSLTSQQISEQLGELVMTKMKKKVDLHTPDINCRVDLVAGFAFIYFEKIEGQNLFKINDRREGIKYACQLAQPGDLVLITGKGTEQSIKSNGMVRPWDDRLAAREILKEKIK